MSRWSKRSQTDKERISLEQEALRKAPERRVEERQEKNAEQGQAVYRAGEIPIMCMEHGWQGSDDYRAYLGKSVFASGEVQYIEGTCRVCKKKIRRLFPLYVGSAAWDEGPIFAMALMHLARDGRLKDERGR